MKLEGIPGVSKGWKPVPGRQVTISEEDGSMKQTNRRRGSKDVGSTIQGSLSLNLIIYGHRGTVESLTQRNEIAFVLFFVVVVVVVCF